MDTARHAPDPRRDDRATIVDRFIVAHLEEHATQLDSLDRYDGRSGSPAPNLGLEVERHDGRLVLVAAPRLARDAPHDLEFVAVRISAVQRLADAVIRGAGQRTKLRQGLGHLGERLDRIDLPGKVVEPNRASRWTRRVGSDLEQAEVMVVAAGGRAHEGGPHPRWAAQLLEAERSPIELGGGIGVADEEDRMVESVDWHSISAPGAKLRSSSSHSGR